MNVSTLNLTQKYFVTKIALEINTHEKNPEQSQSNIHELRITWFCAVSYFFLRGHTRVMCRFNPTPFDTISPQAAQARSKNS